MPEVLVVGLNAEPEPRKGEEGVPLEQHQQQKTGYTRQGRLSK